MPTMRSKTPAPTEPPAARARASTTAAEPSAASEATTSAPSTPEPSASPAAPAEPSGAGRRLKNDGERAGEIVTCLIRLDLQYLWREDATRDDAIAAFMSGFKGVVKPWEDGPELAFGPSVMPTATQLHQAAQIVMHVVGAISQGEGWSRIEDAYRALVDKGRARARVVEDIDWYVRSYHRSAKGEGVLRSLVARLGYWDRRFDRLDLREIRELFDRTRSETEGTPAASDIGPAHIAAQLALLCGAFDEEQRDGEEYERAVKRVKLGFVNAMNPKRRKDS